LLSLCILQENLFLKVHMGEKPVLPCQFKNNKGEAMKIGAFVVAAGLLLPAAASLAGQSSLAGDELRKAISGKTVYLNISGFELPIRYAASGRMSGKMSTIAASLSRGDGSSDTGKWWVGKDQLCQRWSSWMDGKTYCYKLTRNGSNVRWVRNDGHSGTARIGG
jgi:hypothetical protein